MHEPHLGCRTLVIRAPNTKLEIRASADDGSSLKDSLAPSHLTSDNLLGKTALVYQGQYITGSGYETAYLPTIHSTSSYLKSLKQLPVSKARN